MRERLKEPRKGSEIEPEIVCVQGVGAALCCDCVLFVERSSELLVHGELKAFAGGTVKARLKRPTLVSISRPETG